MSDDDMKKNLQRTKPNFVGSKFTEATGTPSRHFILALESKSLKYSARTLKHLLDTLKLPFLHSHVSPRATLFFITHTLMITSGASVAETRLLADVNDAGCSAQPHHIGLAILMIVSLFFFFFFPPLSFALHGHL